jgi:outer membrane protein OmpA-like peptidoglycan-associated protein
MRPRLLAPLASSLLLAAAVSAAQEANLLSLGEGAIPVTVPRNYSGWAAVNVLDDAPSSGWASERGRLTNSVFVFELAGTNTLTAFEFDTAGIDEDGCGAKDVTVEVSSAASAGFQKVLQATLQDRKDAQRFPVSAKLAGRFVRLTIANNHGSTEHTELMGIRGFGARPPAASVPDLSGTYETDYHAFHLRQQGAALTGCYEYEEGVFDGTIEGRVTKLTWTESAGKGPAVFVFAPDGRSFRGYYWSGSDKGRAVDGEWNGKRVTDRVGSCPHWAGSVSGELRKDLAATGRARLYGILFDTDSARLRGESLPTLDEVVRLLSAEAAWKLTIEGHTDSTGTLAHNQTLSEQRASSVKAYLVSKGVAAERLASVGFGQSKPVADNATELGRAQNRRVELVRR